MSLHGIMDYKRELNKMKKHRRLYHPALRRMMALYKGTSRPEFPVEISDFNEMIIILELIDVGYLDEEAFIITRRFGDITGLAYTGDYPFTESGESIYAAGGPGSTLRAIFNAIRGPFKR